MREIKFRAWHEKTKSMLDVAQLTILPGMHSFLAEYSNDSHAISVSIPYQPPPILEIMQYTGLKDKNGVEIYEGDLLDFDIDEWGMDFKPEVVTMEKLIDWDLCGTLSDISNFRAIIGNIYENKELLE